MLNAIRSGFFPAQLPRTLKILPSVDRVTLGARPADCLVRLQRPESPSEKEKLLAKLVQVPNLSSEARETLLRDLGAFPVAVLRLLEKDDLLVVAVRDGQTLADTPRLPTVDPAHYREHVRLARQTVSDAIRGQADARQLRVEQRVAQGEDRVYVEAMESYWEAKGLQEALSQQLAERQIGFAPESFREPFHLEQVAAQRGVPDEHRAEWLAMFAELNADLVHLSHGLATPLHGVALIPYAYHKGRPVSEVTLKQALELKAQRYKDAMGSHNWEERLVVLYEGYLHDPAPEAGHHRVAIHEVGHAFDHALDRHPRLGEEHRRRMDAFFAEDQRRFQQGEDRFTSHRARDSVREYFAEAVEAYLTVPMHDGQDFYKPTNNREDLARLNPDLYAYVDSLFHQDF